MSKPTVSVVMPAYNHEKYVGEALESVLNQTFADLELIVVDDGSTDDTAAVVKAYNDDRIKYHHQLNQDAFNALNKGMALSSGSYIAIINSDDVFIDSRLQRLVEAQDELNAECLFSDVIPITDSSDPITEPTFWWLAWHQNNRRYYYDYKDLYAAFLHANLMITTSNLFMTRHAMETVGEFAPLRYLHDYDYIFRVLNAFPDSVHYLHDEKLLKYRLHGHNTLSDAAVVGREQDLAIIRENLLRKCPASLHTYLKIGIDRIVELEHELVQARTELSAQKDCQPAVDTEPVSGTSVVRKIARRFLR